MQREALTKVECAGIFEEAASGVQRDRPQLIATLDYMRAGDTLIVWRLDRLARLLKQLIEKVAELERRKIGF